MRSGHRQIKGALLLACVLLLALFSGRIRAAGTEPWLYGSQLTGAAKEVYDALAGIRNWEEFAGSGDRDPRREEIRVSFSGKYRMAESARLAGECLTGSMAFLRDRSELFWISGFDLTLGFQDFAGKKRAAAYAVLCPADYYEGIRKEIRRTQAVIDRMVRSVRKYRSRYDKAKAAHDLVLGTVDYAGKGEQKLWHHTVTGGLLARYGHRGVCEAYAKLFDVICRANGIPCILVTGGLKLGTANHMWNYIRMDDGNWYLVDVTNDDQKKARHDYFLAGSGTDAFAGRVGATHRPSGNLHAGQAKPFHLPALSAVSYDTAAAKRSAGSGGGFAFAEWKTFRTDAGRKLWSRMLFRIFPANFIIYS